MHRFIALFMIAILPMQGSLTFGSATTNKVNCGSASVLDNIAAGTVAIWYRPAGVATYRALVAKSPTSYAGYMILSSSSSGNVRFQVRRATTNLDVSSASSALAANTWYFIAATWDTAGAAPKVYRGTASAPVADISSGSPTAGAGAVNDQSSADLQIGNETPTSTGSANGRISPVTIWNRVLTLGELENHKNRPRVTPDVVLHWLGTTTANHADYSGYAHPCVVTGATVADNPPIGPLFGFNLIDLTRRFLKLHA